ncbi:MAG: uridylate kinase [Candidatus Babeliales bacterium]
MSEKKRILLKLTGEAFLSTTDNSLNPSLVIDLVRQIKQLMNCYQFGLVIGGGNFFRGKQHGKVMNITPPVGHQIGMLATLMNGLMMKDLLEQHGVIASLFSAITCPEMASSISQQAIENALLKDQVIIFAGGTGNPFFSTDTTAVLRSLQINAEEIWKASHIDGVYTADPKINPEAKILKNITYQYALDHKLGIMDATAFTLAAENKQVIRVFSAFEPNALIKATQNKDFGSIIHV